MAANHYIQLKTGCQGIKVTRVDGSDSVVFNAADDVSNTTYIDASRAKALALCLMKAAAHAEAAKREAA